MNPPRTPQDRRTGARRTALGVGAGALAGAAIGLTMVVPSFTSAATDESTLEAPAAEVSPLTEQDQVEPGSRLRETLQPLVDDGTITAEQADAVAEHLVEHRPERPGREERREHRRERFDGDVVAEIIGIDAEALRTELREGSSIAEIAEANGVDPQAVVDALVAEASDHLDVAVENGRLTAEEAAERLAERTERIEARVAGEHPERPADPVDPDA